MVFFQLSMQSFLSFYDFYAPLFISQDRLEWLYIIIDNKVTNQKYSKKKKTFDFGWSKEAIREHKKEH